MADTFIVLWKSADYIDYKTYKNLKSYIGMIARNKSKDWLRQYNGKKIGMYDNVFFTDAGVEGYIIQKEQSEFIRELIANLSDKDQKIFFLYYYQYKKIEEIAGILEMNIQTVKSRLRRGRCLLKRLLENVEKR